MSYNFLLNIMTIIFSLVILSISIAVTVKKKYNFLVANIVTYIIYLIFLFVQYKLKFQVNVFIILLFMMTIIGNNFFGQYLDYYHRSKTFDRYLHTFGSFSFSLFVYSILEKIIVPEVNSKVYISIFVATIGISFGCLLEILEFLLDFKSKSKNQHGLFDTDYDLIANVIGSTIAGVVSTVFFF